MHALQSWHMWSTLSTGEASSKQQMMLASSSGNSTRSAVNCAPLAVPCYLHHHRGEEHILLASVCCALPACGLSRDYDAMCQDYYTLQFMDPAIDTAPIAPALQVSLPGAARVVADISRPLATSLVCIFIWCWHEIPVPSRCVSLQQSSTIFCCAESALLPLTSCLPRFSCRSCRTSQHCCGFLSRRSLTTSSMQV